ncbi:DUF3347 domain-containing protein [Flavobacterium seoulense]|uniref:DUF3347 domain-containing protein n=1 Tax=Flavobacterium seoulense TaxID=1492738 RepID=A0A066WWE0_9FLAO|nr:DUF3347 domain-containing protein [Flavobacterium seoulense]KDN56878.1 hypothetical protein FEM21_03810 [Flavobacterium seoulense]
MKKIILSSMLLAFVMLSCNQKNKEDKISETPVAVKIDAGDTKVEIAEVNADVKASVSTDAIIDAYLKIKNALANDKGKEATAAANDFAKAVAETKTDKISKELLTKYSNITDDAKAQAALIVSNYGKIDQQRMYFAVLSKDITNLIATFGTNKKLFQDYCPMYNEGKSGYWISEMKAIRNPYYGSEMLECGGMIKEIK